MKPNQIIKKSALILGMLAISASAVVSNEPLIRLKQRAVMVVMHERCQLFSPHTAQSLKSAFVLSRNEALRAGANIAYLAHNLRLEVDALSQRTCDDAAVLAEARKVDAGFSQFHSQPRLALKGARGVWLAEKTRFKENQWRLVQFARGEGVELGLGLYGPLSSPSFLVMIKDNDKRFKPYTVKLHLRDVQKNPVGLINQDENPVSGQMPLGFDGYGEKLFFATHMKKTKAQTRAHERTNEVGFTKSGEFLGKQDLVPAYQFGLPSHAFKDIALLDPREDVVLEIVSRDDVRFVRLEVGDFIPGLNFILQSAQAKAKTSGQGS